MEICLKRDSLRKGQYGKEAVTAVYNLVSKVDCGKKINTSELSVQQTVKKIILEINTK